MDACQSEWAIRAESSWLGKEIRGTGRGLFHGKSGKRKLQQGIQGKLRSAIEQYVHFYNYERFQKRFGVRTPMEVRTAALTADWPYTRRGLSCRISSSRPGIRSLFLCAFFQLQHIPIKVGHKQSVLNHTVFFKFCLSMKLCNFCGHLACVL